MSNNEADDSQPARRIILGVLLTLNVFASAIFVASIVGLARSPQWTLTATTALGVGIWGVFLLVSCYIYFLKGKESNEMLAWTRKLSMCGFFASILTGILLTLGPVTSCGAYWLIVFYHIMGYLQALLCLLVWILLPRFVRPYVGYDLKEGRHTRPVKRWWVPTFLYMASLVAFWLVVWHLSGDSGTDTVYPNPRTSPYKLPFPKGEFSFVGQGNFGKWSHSNSYAIDFSRPCGTPVLASRAGIVYEVIDDCDDLNNVWTGWTCGNGISIHHEDGSVASYWHHSQGTAMVQVGDQVEQGTVLAFVGNTGYSSGPHIHFEASAPVTFQDVGGDGLPHALGIYKSGNVQLRN